MKTIDHGAYASATKLMPPVPPYRSYCLTQEIRGKTVYTRTIAFNITAHTYSNSSSSDDDDDTPFQRHLKLHLERAYEGTGREERNAASDVSLCLEFLHTLGGVTHYVSSITLGAMEYSVKKVQVSGLAEATVKKRTKTKRIWTRIDHP